MRRFKTVYQPRGREVAFVETVHRGDAADCIRLGPMFNLELHQALGTGVAALQNGPISMMHWTTWVLANNLESEFGPPHDHRKPIDMELLSLRDPGGPYMKGDGSGVVVTLPLTLAIAEAFAPLDATQSQSHLIIDACSLKDAKSKQGKTASGGYTTPLFLNEVCTRVIT